MISSTCPGQPGSSPGAHRKRLEREMATLRSELAKCPEHPSTRAPGGKMQRQHIYLITYVYIYVKELKAPFNTGSGNSLNCRLVVFPTPSKSQKDMSKSNRIPVQYQTRSSQVLSLQHGSAMAPTRQPSCHPLPQPSAGTLGRECPRFMWS